MRKIIIIAVILIISILTGLTYFAAQKNKSEIQSTTLLEAVTTDSIPFEITISPINYRKEATAEGYSVGGYIAITDAKAQEMLKGKSLARYFSVGNLITIYPKNNTKLTGSIPVEGFNTNLKANIKGHFDTRKVKFLADEINILNIN